MTGADAIPAALLAAGERRPEVRALWLFGSRADGTVREGSDVDVGVLWEPGQPLEATMSLEEDLSRTTGLPVDVVDARRAGAFLALEIVRGERLFCRNEVATDLFELYVLRRAGDLMPFERERQAMLLGRPRVTPGRVRRVVVADKVETIRRMLDGIGTLPLADLSAFRADPRMVAAGDSFLRRALEALLDLGRHILAKGFGRAPAEYAEVARQLEETAVLDPARASRLALMARYRNRLVHFYEEIGDEELFDVLKTGPADVRDVLSALVAWVGANPEKVDS